MLEWQFWLQWILVTVLGWVLSLAFNRIVGYPFVRGGRSWGSLFVSLGARPIWISLMQWLLLRRRVLRAGWWVGVNVITWLILVSTLVALGPFAGNAWNMEGEIVDTAILTIFCVAVALVTASTGVIPVAFFLHRGVKRAMWWVPANFISLSLIGYGSLPVFHPTWVVQLVLGGVQGATTGLVLAWMLSDTQKMAASRD